LSTTGPGTLSGNSGTVTISIHASGRIVCPEFDAVSDARIKNVLGRTDNAADLNTLNQIQITNYRFIDTIGKGNKVMKKVIAQELEQVYPNAVNRMTDAVPDIYQLATVQDGRVLLANTLKKGDKVRLIFNDSTATKEVLEADPQGFNIAAIENGSVFVYGREVTDFRTVDYEALTTLNISATQELVKKINQLEQEVNRLSTLNADVQQIKQALHLNQPVAPQSDLRAEK
jgi:hypothetical protein